VSRGGLRRVARALGGLAALIALVLFAAALVSPPGLEALASHPHPARSYDEARRRWANVEARDTPEIGPECRARVFDHGQRTRDVLVLLHGLTNCPKQFEVFGRRFYERGWNVLIVRLPHHGLSDRMTRDLEHLDAGELTRVTDEAVDIADGFGERVTVAGLSLGGVTAAWAGQERGDVERAVVIAPIFGVALVPRMFTAALTRVLLALPNRFVWWNSRLRQNLDGPRQAYPRFSTHALGELLRLALAVDAAAGRRPPAAERLVMVSVAGDHAANNDASAEVATRWKLARAEVETYVFPASLRLDHDLIDPAQLRARTDLVYPELERLIAPQSAGPIAPK
jgi:carboxylesterase